MRSYIRWTNKIVHKTSPCRLNAYLGKFPSYAVHATEPFAKPTCIWRRLNVPSRGAIHLRIGDFRVQNVGNGFVSRNNSVESVETRSMGCRQWGIETREYRESGRMWTQIASKEIKHGRCAAWQTRERERGAKELHTGNLHIVIYADLIHTRLERTLRCARYTAEEYNDFRENRFMHKIKDFTYVSICFPLNPYLLHVVDHLRGQMDLW